MKAYVYSALSATQAPRFEGTYEPDEMPPVRKGRVTCVCHFAVEEREDGNQNWIHPGEVPIEFTGAGCFKSSDG